MKLGILIGLVVGVAATLAVVALVGRGDEPSPRQRVYTVQGGDEIRAPAAATRCLASQEGGFENLFCSRMPYGRFQVVFYEDSVVVWRAGNPDGPVYSVPWKP